MGRFGPAGAELGVKSHSVRSEVCLRPLTLDWPGHSAEPLEEVSPSWAPEPTQYKAGCAQGCTARKEGGKGSACAYHGKQVHSVFEKEGRRKKRGKTHISGLTLTEIYETESGMTKKTNNEILFNLTFWVMFSKQSLEPWQRNVLCSQEGHWEKQKGALDLLAVPWILPCWHWPPRSGVDRTWRVGGR